MTFMAWDKTASSMNDESRRQSHLARGAAILWKMVCASATVIGFLVIACLVILPVLQRTFYAKEVIRQLSGPGGAGTAEIEVTKGSLGTAWTTRVHLRKSPLQRWTIYQNRDSDFVPPLHWADHTTLVVGLPCDEFDHLSNPDDWEWGK
jgi:hypothetical protein